MTTPAVASEIALYKSQLDEFLAQKYVDQPLLLGFCAVIESKFLEWISADIRDYYAKCVAAEGPPPQQELFGLIALLENLWGQFLHPILNFYFQQHRELYQILVRSLKEAKSKFRLVEMRKLNESYAKFVNSAHLMYDLLSRHLAGKYCNRLVPANYLSSLNIADAENAVSVENADFNANLAYVLHHCLLAQGNLSRQLTLISISYVLPCQSVASYYKHLRSLKESEQEAKKKYVTALLYYSKCIGLLPTLNEPYSHIGMIFVSLNQNFSATLWLLRSQLTRMPSYPKGKRNLANIFTRLSLEASYQRAAAQPDGKLALDDMETILLRLIAYYFYPSFRTPFNASQVQTHVLNQLFSKEGGLATLDNSSIIGDQLTVLLSFFSLQSDTFGNINPGFLKFVTHYIVRYLHRVIGSSGELMASGSLRNIRIILAFSRKNPGLGNFAPALVGVLNAMLREVDENTRAKILDACTERRTPVRSYYFSEDVQFKDFRPIGFQFKDFNDDMLFASGNVNVLFGSDFYLKKSEIPSFLDNDAVLRIMKDVELNGEQDKQLAIEEECRRYENEMRLTAVAVMTFKLFKPAVSVDNNAIKLDSVQIPDSQAPKRKQRTHQAVQNRYIPGYTLKPKPKPKKVEKVEKEVEKETEKVEVEKAELVEPVEKMEMDEEAETGEEVEMGGNVEASEVENAGSVETGENMEMPGNFETPEEADNAENAKTEVNVAQNLENTPPARSSPAPRILSGVPSSLSEIELIILCHASGLGSTNHGMASDREDMVNSVVGGEHVLVSQTQSSQHSNGPHSQAQTARNAPASLQSEVRIDLQLSPVEVAPPSQQIQIQTQKQIQQTQAQSQAQNGLSRSSQSQGSEHHESLVHTQYLRTPIQVSQTQTPTQYAQDMHQIPGQFSGQFSGQVPGQVPGQMPYAQYPVAQAGYQGSFQPGFPGYQPAYQAGYQPGYQGGFQPPYQQYAAYQTGFQPAPMPGYYPATQYGALQSTLPYDVYATQNVMGSGSLQNGNGMWQGSSSQTSDLGRGTSSSLQTSQQTQNIPQYPY